MEGTLKINLLLRILDEIGNWIGRITSFLMFFIIGFMLISTFFRYVLRDPIPYLNAVPNIFFVYVCLGAAFAYNQRAFVNVDILYRRFSTRQRAAIDLITSLLFYAFMFVLLQTSLSYASPALAKFKFNFGMLLDPTKWPTTILFPTGPILLLVAGTVRLLRNILVLIGQGQPATADENTAAEEQN